MEAAELRWHDAFNRSPLQALALPPRVTMEAPESPWQGGMAAEADW